MCHVKLKTHGTFYSYIFSYKIPFGVLLQYNMYNRKLFQCSNSLYNNCNVCVVSQSNK